MSNSPKTSQSPGKAFRFPMTLCRISAAEKGWRNGGFPLRLAWNFRCINHYLVPDMFCGPDSHSNLSGPVICISFARIILVNRRSWLKQVLLTKLGRKLLKQKKEFRVNYGFSVSYKIYLQDTIYTFLIFPQEIFGYVLVGFTITSSKLNTRVQNLKEYSSSQAKTLLLSF